MTLNRRQLLVSFGAGLVTTAAACKNAAPSEPSIATPKPLRKSSGDVDWDAVRELFPLSREWTHLAGFLLASHPRPVSEAIAAARQKLDAEPGWLEDAAFLDSEGHPFATPKQAIAYYVGDSPQNVCVTPNTTTALAMAYHGLRIRSDQHILTTEHDHYVHHESIRYSAERSGAGVKYVALYDDPAKASAAEMTMRLAKAIGPKTRAIGITWVHSGTGVKTPVATIAEAVWEANRGRASADRCLLIVDGVHGFGNQDVAAARMGADLFAASNHKWLCGPRGTGFLWGKTDAWPELRPTIPSFDLDGQQTWDAWMNRQPLPPTQAAFVSPGGFIAFEHLLAVPAAVGIHKDIGRSRIADRIHELNTAFREGAASIKGVTLHTPIGRDVSAGLSAFEVAGVKPEQVTERLRAKKIRTSHSPYRVSYPRVSAGIMNSHADIDTVLRELRTISGGSL
jgi:selenocysteine lyase/cysteine desulfurase